MKYYNRKALYVFLSCLLGTLLFLLLHRVVAFFYILALESSYSTFSFGLSYIELLALEYFTLLLSLLLGGWYGIWLGIYWYEAVYEHKHFGGLVDHIVCSWWPNSKSVGTLRNEVNAAAKKFEQNLSEVEKVTPSLPKISAVKPRVISKPRPAAAAPIQAKTVVKPKIVTKPFVAPAPSFTPSVSLAPKKLRVVKSKGISPGVVSPTASIKTGRSSAAKRNTVLS
jgi:hypothetical protein